MTRTGKAQREVIADGMVVLGGVLLFASLFLTWSHQFSRPFLARFGDSSQLREVPHDPTAWQVYSAADVVLALLALGLVAVALRGGRPVRLTAIAAAIAGLIFTIHATSAPPTNGANIFDPSLSVPNLFPDSPTAGVGETVAIAGLTVAIAGLLASVTAD